MPSSRGAAAQSSPKIRGGPPLPPPASRPQPAAAHSIGRAVKVWWAQEQRWFVGLIDYFDSITQRHRVMYSDCEWEFLRIEEETLDFVDLRCFTREAAKYASCPSSSNRRDARDAAEAATKYAIELPRLWQGEDCCMICLSNTRKDTILLCDARGCGGQAHLACLQPPLDDVPKKDWFCPRCSSPRKYPGKHL